MSCNIGDMAQEMSWEAFQEKLDNDYDFRGFIEEAFVPDEHQYQVWKMGHEMEDYVDIESVFNELWEYDCVGMFYDPMSVINSYLSAKYGK
jgi:hypothetical protein